VKWFKASKTGRAKTTPGEGAGEEGGGGEGRVKGWSSTVWVRKMHAGEEGGVVERKGDE